MTRRPASLPIEGRMAVVVSALVLLVSAVPQAAAAPSTTRVSVSSTGAQAAASSWEASISANGRYVSFTSDAKLVPGDTDSYSDVYLRDRATGQTRHVSVAASGTQANDDSDQPRISADGRYVVFRSFASNLVPGSSGSPRLYRHDVVTGGLELLAMPAGASSLGFPAPSSSGRYVAFRAVVASFPNIYRLDTATGQIRRATETAAGAVHSFNTAAPSLPSDGTGGPSISADGRWIGFVSSANNLSAPDTQGYRDVFVKDLDSGSVESISSAGGVEANLHSSFPALSADGCVVAFYSTASNIVAGDTNRSNDVFARDRCGATGTAIVSRNNSNGQATQIQTPISISADGCKVAFMTSNLLSPLPTSPPAAALRDRCAGLTSRLDVSTAGDIGQGGMYDLAISATGRYVTLTSSANNLIAGDTNGLYDVFVRDLATNTAPVAALTTAVSGLNVAVDATASHDPDGHQLTGSINYGDGSPPQAGLSGVHDYARPGTYGVTLVVTDADGSSDIETAIVTVSDPRSGTGPPTGGGGGGDLPPDGPAALTLDRVSLSKSRFAVVPRNGKPDGARGATLSLRLSAAATVTLAFERVRSGRRSGGKCKPRAKQGARCTIYAKAKTIKRSLPAGSSRIALTGRVGSGALAVGKHRLTVGARAADGRRAAPKRLTITIAKAKARR